MEGIRSFHTGEIGNEGQRAAKLLAIEVGVLKKMSAALAIPAEVCGSTFGPGLSRIILKGNFAALVLKDLAPSQIVSKVQKADSILRVGFALSK